MSQSNDAPITPSYDRVSDVKPAVTPTPAAPAAPEPEAKITFTPEQQQKVDSIIRESHSRIAREVRAENEKLRKSLDAALKAASPDATEADKWKAKADAAEMRLSDLTQEYARERLENAIAAAAHQSNFIDPQQASLLIDKSGLTKEDGTVDTAKVAEAVKSLAQRSDHLIRGVTKGGSGSGPASTPVVPSVPLEQLFGRSSSAALANKLALTNPTAYRAARALAAKKGLI